MRDKFFVHKLLLLCVLAIFITSCAAPEKSVSVACKSILETGITPTTFDGVERNEINEWISQRYPIDPDTIEELPYYSVLRSQYVTYNWHYNDGQYGATFLNEEFAGLTIRFSHFSQRQLSGRDFITCLGEPDFYSAAYAWYYEPYLELHLWYVEEGISVRQIIYPEMKPFQEYVPEIKEDTIFNDTIVAYMADNNIESMVSTFYNPLRDRQVSPTLDERLESLQVWESWDTLQLQIDPMLQ